METIDEYKELRAEIRNMPDKEFFGCNLYPLTDRIDRLERMYWAFRAALQRIEEFEEGSHRYGLVRAIASESLRNNILGE